MLGDFSVGKTSLIRRFVERQFSDEYLSTVGVKISRKSVEFTSVKHQKMVNLQMLIWDLEGNTKFKAITPMHLQGASSAVVVADVSRQVTLNNIPAHVECFLSVNPKGFVVIALNKSDIIDRDNVLEMLKVLPFKEQKEVIAIYPTSAKTGKYVDLLFKKLAWRMLKLG